MDKSRFALNKVKNPIKQLRNPNRKDITAIHFEYSYTQYLTDPNT